MNEFTYATGAARAIARQIRLTIEAQRGQQGSGTTRVKQRWDTISALADLIEGLGDDDPAVIVLAAAHQLRGGTTGGWSPAEAQSRAIQETFTLPAAKKPEPVSEVFARLMAATLEDVAAHARVERNGALEAEVQAAQRDVERADERAVAAEDQLRSAREREDQLHEDTRRMQLTIDELQQRVAGIVNDWVSEGEGAMARLAVEAARESHQVAEAEAPA